MSHITFHTIDKEYEIKGCERAMFANLMADITYGVLTLELCKYGHNGENIKKIIAHDCYLNELPPSDFVRSFKTWMSVENKPFVVNGEKYDSFATILNTATCFGSDIIKLAARIHGQCEIHGYFHAREIGWLCDVINDGLESGLYRENMGWRELISGINKSSCGDIVMSYSVCEGFPDSSLVKMSRSKFEKLSHEDAWEKCFRSLQKDPRNLMISESNIGSTMFDHGLNILQLIKMANSGAHDAR